MINEVSKLLTESNKKVRFTNKNEIFEISRNKVTDISAELKQENIL